MCGRFPPAADSPAWRHPSSYHPLQRRAGHLGGARCIDAGQLNSATAVSPGSIRDGDAAVGLNYVLKMALNGDFVLEDKLAWFILYSEDGI